jgi:hypothetical protein
VSTPRPRAYLITIREFVVVTRDPRDLREIVAEAARDDHQAQALTAEELARCGESYPVGSWDPDRELTCAEIAEEMRKP